MNALSEWLSSNGLMPHGFCYQWKPALIWLHVVSDTLIALAYFSIPIALVYFARRRRDVPFGWMFVCFGVFIAACGATHVMDVWTLWVPSYWFSGGVKVVTALASVPTAIFLVRLMPTALHLPSPEEMRAANEQLKRQATTLRQSEERFLQMAENIQEIFWVMDPETKEATYVSPAFEQICELRVESIYSNPTSYRELIHPEDRQRVLAGLEDLATTNRFDEEFRIVCPSGTLKWLRAIGFNAKDAAGVVQRFVGTVQEITARKKMEFALRESEDLFRDLVEHSSDLICTHDLKGRLLHVNELPAKLLGYTREELINKPMREFLLPEARAQFDESLLTIQKEGFVKGLMVVLTKTGERRVWEYHNTLRTDGVNAPIVRGIAHDVTDQKRMERALRLSEEKFSKAFLASPYAIVISTIEEDRLIDVNDSFLRTMGFSREQVIGRTSLELGLWVDPGDLDKILAEVSGAGRVRSTEINFQTKEGRHLVVNYSAEVIELARRNCLLSVYEDISERKQAEEKLRQVRARMESVLNGVADTHILLDSDWRYLYVNDAAVRAMGRPREEIVNLTLWELYPDVIGTEFERQFRRAMEEGIYVAFEFHYESLDTWWENRLYPAPEGLAVFATEITERKRSEKEVRRLSGQLLRLQDEERRKLARDLHDSTGQDLVALALILGQLRSSVSPLDQKSHKLLSACKKFANRCIRDVRTHSYLLHPPALEHAGLAEAIREYVKGFTQRSDIEVELALSPGLGRLQPDVELAVFRVVQESLTNIQRHSESPRARIQIQRGGDLRVEISDVGRGILARAPKRTGVASFGVGVGIRSMEERVKLIGGRLEIDSTANGTTVCVVIPIGGEHSFAAANS